MIQTILESGSQTSASTTCDGPKILRFPTLHAPRIQNPVRTPRRRKYVPAPQQESFWEEGMDPDVLAHAVEIQDEIRDQVVPEYQREWIRENLSIRQFYEDWMLQDRNRRCAAGKLSKGSLEKDRQALARWERATRPETWPKEKPWPGLPIGLITDRYVTMSMEKLVKLTSEATAKSTWNHLRTMLNHAVAIRALDRAPKPEITKVEPKKPRKLKDSEIADIYAGFAPHLELQVAFVLGINIGPRTEDLFSLRWDAIEWCDRPTITYTARKTKKQQTVPLNATVLTHLARLSSKGNSPYLFPSLFNPYAKSPEKSRPARIRRKIVSSVFSAAGVITPKPFQTVRVTCNSRLNRFRPESGKFVLGHALTLNAKHYHDPTDEVFDALEGVPQPDCFRI